MKNKNEKSTTNVLKMEAVLEDFLSNHIYLFRLKKTKIIIPATPDGNFDLEI